MLNLLRSGLVALAALACLPLSAVADNLPQPTGRIILSVSGNIERTTDGEVAQFDRDLLEQVGLDQIRTSTPWYDDIVTFEGVLAARLLDHLGADGKQVIAIALNDYRAEIPLSDFVEKGVLLALKVNGDYLSVRDKGPIFIIYPFDSNEDLRNETHFVRSVWQLKALEIK